MRPLVAWFFASIASLFAATPAARADRYSTGQLVYQLRCTSCHQVGWQKPGPAERGRLDLTRVTDRRSEADLRRLLDGRTAIPGRSACRPGLLATDQIDDVILFLRTRAAPLPPPPRALPKSRNPRPAMSAKAR